MNKRLTQQIKFIATLDEMKQIFRATRLIKDKRRENDAEHSYHIAIMAIILEEYADFDFDLDHSIKLLLFHDVVEILAGDTYAYDAEANKSKSSREIEAAEKLYSILPEDQCNKFKALWYEFEAEKTPEARFALAMDRIQPILLNILGNSGTWREHQVEKEQVLSRIEPIKEISTTLYDYTLSLIDQYDFHEHKLN